VIAGLALREQYASSSLGFLVDGGAEKDDGLELTRALAAGSTDALRTAYARHHDAVRAFARRLVGDEAAAEDLVHEVFVALPKAAKRFRGDASLRTFLLSIAANASRHAVRAAARRRQAMARYAQEPEDSVAAPDGDVERARLAALLSRALDELPLDQRLAFVLCEVEERSSREVAVIVDAPEGTVRTRLFHAKQKLRTILEREGVR
jgi:RNA polymerase sigma-70 factor (ECF subfamily)